MEELLEEYIIAHSEQEPAYLAAINRKAHIRLINPRMISGHLQGRFLKLLCEMIRPKTILELGTYAGYSALCMAETLPDDGVLHTIECEDELEDFIHENLASVPHGAKVKLHIGDALTVIPQMGNIEFDFVFIDADKKEYLAYYEAVLPLVREGGFIFADNTIWNGKVIEPLARNDKQTKAILEFNDFVASDQRVEKIILPLRDGLTIIRKKEVKK